MDFGRYRRIEYPRGLRVQKLRVLRIDDKPAQLRRKRLDQMDIRDEPLEEYASRNAVIARLRSMRDEIATFEAFLHG